MKRTELANSQQAANAIFKRQRSCSNDADSDLEMADSQKPLFDNLDRFVSLHEAFDLVAETFPDQAAVEDDSGACWTYAQLKDASLRIASALQSSLGNRTIKDSASSPIVVLLMHRTCEWVAACLACMRLGCRSLALSADLNNADEDKRMHEALTEHQPALLVVDKALRSRAEAAVCALGVALVETPELMLGNREYTTLLEPLSRSADDTVYLVYTGGTTSASKCVAVTHRMALSELVTYPAIAPLSCTDRVLHQSSAFWGATSLGIFDIAWACGGCLVLTEQGSGPADVATVVVSRCITVIGVVPSVLEALDCEKCPSVRTVFTWGEALAKSTALRWSTHAALFDLLIASEYWLVLVADHRSRCGDDSRMGFRAVPAAQLTLRPPDEGADPRLSVDDGEVGELYLAGPMVSAVGYTDESRNDGVFVDLPMGPQGQAVRHYRTRDLVRRRQDGLLEYCGRADGFAKVGGKWLDLAAVETSLREAGCQEAALVWDSQTQQRHAAVVLAAGAGTWFERVAALRRLLPPSTQLHVLASLPHHPSTGKVQRGLLMEQLRNAAPQRAEPASAPRVRQSLLWGLRIAARKGIRGSSVLPAAWALAPGMVQSSGKPGSILQELPSGLREHWSQWAFWHWVLDRCAPSNVLAALPHIYLLLMDADTTGLSLFQTLVEGPLGVFGTAVVLTCLASRWLRNLLVAASLRYAARQNRDQWPWMFWLGLPYLAEHWTGELWTSERGCTGRLRCEQATRAISPFLKPGMLKADLKMVRCTHCNDWAGVCNAWTGAGEFWHGDFYCQLCSSNWRRRKYAKQEAQDTKECSNEGQFALPHAAPNGKKAPRDSDTSSKLVSNESQELAETVPDSGRSNATEKWKPICDEVDFLRTEVQRAETFVPKRTNGVNAGGALTPIGRVVEKCCGITACGPEASLAGLESLKVIALVSALRRELGFNLSASDVTQCSSLGELEECCAKSGTQSGPQPLSGEKEVPDQSGWSIFAIPRFWKAPVAWLFRLDAVPSEVAMRAACCALVRRHASLRAIPPVSAGDTNLATLCINAAPQFVVWQSIMDGHAAGFVKLVTKGILDTWPRTGIRPQCEPKRPLADADLDTANFQWSTFGSEQEVKKAAWIKARSRGFLAPMAVSVFIVSAEGKDAVAFLQLAVNHAVSDAASILPMVADLLQLHTAAQTIMKKPGMAPTLSELAVAALNHANLPPAPNGMAISQERLKATFHGKATTALDLVHSAFHPRRFGYDHYVRMKANATRMLQIASAVLGIPDDHCMVLILVAAFARITQLPEVKLSLIVTMRDGHGESHSVANLSNTRHLRLWVKGCSFLAVALDLSQRLRRRDWELFDVLGDDGDRLFINLRGIPRFEGATPEMPTVDTSRQTTRTVRNMIEMFADQEDQQNWAMWLGIRNDLDGTAFASSLREALWLMATDPLATMSGDSTMNCSSEQVSNGS